MTQRFLRYTTLAATRRRARSATNHATPPDVGSILAQIFSATVTVSDPTKPSIDRVLATGLGAGGLVGGEEPLAFDASDNSGIRSAQLVDATPGGPETVVGRKEFACDYSYAAPCPQASGAEITPSGLPAGQRLLKVQVTDAGGNVSETAAVSGDGRRCSSTGRPPSPGRSSRPRSPATAAARSRSRYGKRASIRGKLTTAAGVPIGGASLQVLDRPVAQRDEVRACGPRSRPRRTAASRCCPGRGPRGRSASSTGTGGCSPTLMWPPRSSCVCRPERR